MRNNTKTLIIASCLEDCIDAITKIRLDFVDKNPCDLVTLAMRKGLVSYDTPTIDDLQAEVSENVLADATYLAVIKLLDNLTKGVID